MAAIGLVASAIGGFIVYLLLRVLWDIVRLLADTMLDNVALKDLLSKQW